MDPDPVIAFFKQLIILPSVELIGFKLLLPSVKRCILFMEIPGN